jgi:hypothetical protein
MVLLLCACPSPKVPRVPCMGTVVATWTAKGLEESSGSAVFFAQDGGTFVLSVQDCDDSSVVTLSELPYPVATGTFPLTFKPNHLGAPDGGAGGEYDVVGDTSYFTDESDLGSVVISSVDATAKQFSGTFSFHATDDTGAKSVDVTSGVLTKIDFE